MWKKIAKYVLWSKPHSIAEAAAYASYIYGHYQGSSNSIIVKTLPRFCFEKVIGTKTALHIACYIDSDYPAAYQTIAIRGTVGVNDHWYDGIQHAVNNNGITDYQIDAYIKHW